MTDINEKAAAPDTAAKLTELINQFKAGTLQVFKTDTFTVDNKNLNEYIADVDTDPNYTPDTNVIKDGYFHESEFRSAPYFDIIIDGISILQG